MSVEPSPPLSEARLAAYLRGELSDASRVQVEAAMDADPQWLSVLALLAADQDAATIDGSTPDGSTVDRIERQFAARLHPGEPVGRFIVEHPLGRGGMGTVYAARDPELGRAVALKLLHTSGRADQTRLTAEARALAQVNVPNVITVHDVGHWRQRVFLAMELLEGETLHHWRRAAPRAWTEVLDAYLDAGEGLAAAHQAGLVHRDVKPSNVMRTLGGRVVLVDFGLAIAVAEPVLETPSPVRRDARGDATRDSSRAGTPAYMAPEQRRGEPCTPAADQFSLCVALHEALCGALPEASSIPLRSAGFEACPRVPRRVLRVVARGLQLDPSARFGSMRDLLDALQDARSAPVWPVGVGLLGVVAAGALWPVNTDEPASCTGAAAAMDETWSDARRDAVDTALRSTARSWSDGTARAVVQAIDAYAVRWRAAHVDVCLAELDDASLGARMLCLDRRRRRLDALVDVLSKADDDVGLHAIEATDALPEIEDCAEAEGSSSRDPEREAIRDRLAYAESLRDTAAFDRAAEAAANALERTVIRRDAALEAEARSLVGWIAHDQGRYDDAEEQLRLALAAATVSRNDAAATTALHRLAWVVGYKLGRHAEGLQLVAQAEAWSTRLGGRYDDEISRALTRGWIATESADPAGARAAFERVATLARTLPVDHPDRTYDLGLALNGLGSAYLLEGDVEAADASMLQSVALLEARLGAAHPRVAQTRNNRASTLRALGKVEEARQLLLEVRAVFEAAHGPEHILVGQAATNLTVVLTDLGRFEEAIEQADDAERIITATTGEAHPMVATTISLRGQAHLALERYDDAVRDMHRALALQIEVLGDDHASTGMTRTNLSIAYDHMGKLPEAIEQQERALEILVAAHGDAHFFVATARMNLAFLERRNGRDERSLQLYEAAAEHAEASTRCLALLGMSEVLLRLERPEEVLPLLDEAATRLVDAPASFGSRAEVLLYQAYAQWQLGHRPEAKRLADRALAQAQVDEDPDYVQMVRDWQASPTGFPPDRAL
ncbi:MAG: serine/threonine-protein kinase [Myxococcota bacterium]